MTKTSVISRQLAERKKRAEACGKALAKLYPNAKIALTFGNHWELLVAVVLSAQCTDKKVNEVTEKLFRKYKTLDDYIQADSSQFEQDIKSTGFYRNKTKNILAAAKMLKEKFGGKLPRTMEEMLTLPGVARKSANVILGNAYGVVEGIAVDTHVRRLSLKLDLTSSTDPKKIERDLMELFPKKDWFMLTYRLIEYGRHICPARKHACAEHPLSKIYPPAADRWPKASGKT